MPVVVLDMSVSVNGQVAGTEDGKDHLHDWFFAPEEANTSIVHEVALATDVVIMGRRTFDAGLADEPAGRSRVKTPTIVLTHDEASMPRAANLHAASDPQRAVELAKSLVGEGEIVVQGGAQTANSFLVLGLVDAMRVRICPVLLPQGPQFLGSLPEEVTLELMACEVTSQALHLEYRPRITDRSDSNT